MNPFELKNVDRYRPKRMRWINPLNVKALLYITALAATVAFTIWSRL
jgi:hypothetical protein